MIISVNEETQIRANGFWKYVVCRGYYYYNNTVWAKEDQYPGQVFLAHETSPRLSQICTAALCKSDMIMTGHTAFGLTQSGIIHEKFLNMYSSSFNWEVWLKEW